MAAPASVTTPAGKSDATRRLLVTVSVAAAMVGLAQVPVLGMGAPQMGRPPSLEMGVLDAGIRPFFSAFLLVELVALVIPPLRARRVGTSAERAPLNRAAWILGAVLLTTQLLGIVRYRESVWADLPPPLLLWPQLLAAPLILLALAFAVTRWGLGHGLAVAVGVATLGELWGQAGFILRQVSGSAGSVGTHALMLGALAATVVLVIRVSRRRELPNGPRPATVPFPVSGLGSWQFAAAVVTLPSTLGAFLPSLRSLEGVLDGSLAIGSGTRAFLALDWTLLFGFLFFRPGAVGQLWARWLPDVDRLDVVRAARALLPRGLGLAAAFTVGVPLVVALTAPPAASGAAAGSVARLIVVALLAQDIVEEWAARRRSGPLVSVRPVQRTAEVEPILHALRIAGIDAHARTRCFRGTQQFFAPYAPVEILVPVAREGEARKLLNGR